MYKFVADPYWIKINMPWEAKFTEPFPCIENGIDRTNQVKEWMEKQRDFLTKNSFCDSPFAKPGTLIEIEDGGIIKHFLIGDIITHEQEGCCTASLFSKDATVTRYKVLLEHTYESKEKADS